ncbi:MAG: DNA-binding transcriptional repressor ArsR [Methanomassiliicoccales archaeon PtaB.Bin215]|nr:MAG: DNA-binding transcriptional repressor ArsR [Methanomassiliicoccales archaeon PtaB.Bin215]
MAGEDNGWSGEGNCSLPKEVADGLREAGGREGLLARIPGKDSVKELADRHQALSDPVRLQIIHLLGASELCPCVLKDLTGLTDSKLSYHLSILEKSKLIMWRQNKNWRVYRLTDLGRSYLDRKTI